MRPLSTEDFFTSASFGQSKTAEVDASAAPKGFSQVAEVFLTDVSIRNLGVEELSRSPRNAVAQSFRWTAFRLPNVSPFVLLAALAAVAAWRDPMVFAELAGEVVAVVEANGVGDVCDAIVGLP